MRSTPLLPDYRAAGLALVADARTPAGRRRRAAAAPRGAGRRPIRCRRCSMMSAPTSRSTCRARHDARADERRVRDRPRPACSTPRTSTRAKASMLGVQLGGAAATSIAPCSRRRRPSRSPASFIVDQPRDSRRLRESHRGLLSRRQRDVARPAPPASHRHSLRGGRAGGDRGGRRSLTLSVVSSALRAPHPDADPEHRRGDQPRRLRAQSGDHAQRPGVITGAEIITFDADGECAREHARRRASGPGARGDRLAGRSRSARRRRRRAGA